MPSLPFRPSIHLLALGSLTLSCSSTPDSTATGNAAASGATSAPGTSTTSVSSTGTGGALDATTGISTMSANSSASSITAASTTTSVGGTGGLTTGSGTGGANSDGTLSSTSNSTGGASAATDGTPGAGGSTSGHTTSTGTTGVGGGTTTDPVMSEGCGKTPTITTGNNKQIDVGGSTRTYNIRIPDDYDNSRPYRLILGYHGASLSANLVTNENFYGLWPLSEGSTIFVAPQGLDTGGPFGDGWSNAGGADVEFSRQLIAELENDLCIDKSRIFAEGFSMGGSMAYALACGAPDIIRGVAVHSGGPMSGCAQHDTPVAYFMTHGTQDDLCTYPGYGVPELRDFAEVNGCTTPNPTSSDVEFETGLPNPTDSRSACIEFEGCMDGYPVRSCLFVGGHVWNPGGPDTWVPAEVWDFFSQF